MKSKDANDIKRINDTYPFSRNGSEARRSRFFLRERDPVSKEKDELNHLQTSRGSFLAVSTPILQSLGGWIFIEKKMGKRGMESS